MDVDTVPSTSECNRSMLSMAVIDPEWGTKIGHSRFILQLMKSRMIFLKALSLRQEGYSGKGRKRKKGNSRNDSLLRTMDVTTCNFDYKMIANKMWSSIDNYEIHSNVLKSSMFNVVGQEVLEYQQRYLHRLPVESYGPAIDSYRRSIIATSEYLFKQYNQQKEMLQVREELTTKYIQKQGVHHLFLARVCDKMSERQSAPELSQREKEKMDKRKGHIKLARNIINYILAFNQVDYEGKPELMRIKEKHRSPLPF